jgi:hypothetical protein
VMLRGNAETKADQRRAGNTRIAEIADEALSERPRGSQSVSGHGRRRHVFGKRWFDSFAQGLCTQNHEMGCPCKSQYREKRMECGQKPHDSKAGSERPNDLPDRHAESCGCACRATAEQRAAPWALAVRQCCSPVLGRLCHLAYHTPPYEGRKT